jgi:hypothetical protein
MVEGRVMKTSPNDDASGVVRAIGESFFPMY